MQKYDVRWSMHGLATVDADDPRAAADRVLDACVNWANDDPAGFTVQDAVTYLAADDQSGETQHGRDEKAHPAKTEQFPATGSGLTLREEFLFRIRTALAYGRMCGQHGEPLTEGWAERQADIAMAARETVVATPPGASLDGECLARAVFAADLPHNTLGPDGNMVISAPCAAGAAAERALKVVDVLRPLAAALASASSEPADRTAVQEQDACRDVVTTPEELAALPIKSPLRMATGALAERDILLDGSPCLRFLGGHGNAGGQATLSSAWVEQSLPAIRLHHPDLTASQNRGRLIIAVRDALDGQSAGIGGLGSVVAHNLAIQAVDVVLAIRPIGISERAGSVERAARDAVDAYTSTHNQGVLGSEERNGIVSAVLAVTQDGGGAGSSACPHEDHHGDGRCSPAPAVDGATEWGVDQSWAGQGIVAYPDEATARYEKGLRYDEPTTRVMVREVTPWIEAHR